MKIGVVGLGYWGKKVVPEYLSILYNKKIDQLILYDEQQYARDTFKDINNVKITDNLDKLLDEVDGVHICTPNNTHFNIIKMAIKKNVNVLIEKPITKNSDEAFILVEEALSKGLIFQVGNIFRFSNSMAVIKKLLDDDTIGKIHHMIFFWTHLSPSSSSSNEDVIWDLMPHILDMTNYFLGGWPKEIISTAVQPNISADNIKKSSDILLKYSKDIYILVRISLSNHRKTRDIEIQGENGTILLNPVSQVAHLYKSGTQCDITIERNNTILAEINNFIECIIEKKTKINSAHLGALIVREIENIKRVEENGYKKKI